MQPVEAISPIRVLVIVLVVAFGVELAFMIFAERDGPTGGRDFLVSLLDALFVVAALWPVLWIFVVRPLRATIAERRTFLDRTLAIQEEERSRLARDLHDELGQAQTAVLLGARSIMNAATLADAKIGAEKVVQMAASTIESSRRLARGLATGVLTDLGLAVAADRLCEDVASASGTAIERTIRTGSGRYDPEIEIAAYRVLQESLNNAVRHAQATRLQVVLEDTGGSLRLTVSDNGVGMPRDPSGSRGGGFGIQGMRQRVLLRDGAFSIMSSQAGGTVISATFPHARKRTAS
ncbi:MAG: sensor histidine kinase [Phycisphaeraceae bacterium]|nr:sensor histidine kinase [Phycisphaeraceae bacterium]